MYVITPVKEDRLRIGAVTEPGERSFSKKKKKRREFVPTIRVYTPCLGFDFRLVQDTSSAIPRILSRARRCNLYAGANEPSVLSRRSRSRAESRFVQLRSLLEAQEPPRIERLVNDVPARLPAKSETPIRARVKFPFESSSRARARGGRGSLSHHFVLPLLARASERAPPEIRVLTGECRRYRVRGITIFMDRARSLSRAARYASARRREKPRDFPLRRYFAHT